jgi:hypothetical protein
MAEQKRSELEIVDYVAGLRDMLPACALACNEARTDLSEDESEETGEPSGSQIIRDFPDPATLMGAINERVHVEPAGRTRKAVKAHRINRK